MSDKAITPTRIRAPHGATSTEISWSDGRRFDYPNAFLRGWCPCAGCQGHGGEVAFRPGHDALVRDIAAAGSYALRLTWGDGHDAGLYTYRYLRELADKPEVRELGPAAGERH